MVQSKNWGRDGGKVVKRAAVVVGAGASFQVHNGTVPVLNRELKPPLARELFDARFWNHRRSYAGAEVLGAELGRLAQRQDTAFDLEARLTDYATSADSRTRRHFKDIPPYLRDALVQVNTAYVPSPSNYINLVRRLMQDETHEVFFIVLNYDTLLETALERYDRKLVMTSLDDYVTPSRQGRLIKVHGSTNWAVPIPGTGRGEDQSISWVLALDDFEPTMAAHDQIIMDERVDTSHGWRHAASGRFLYPRLTAPLRGKTFSCPDDHTARLREFPSSCHKFLIIGSSGLDDDLLQLLGEATSGTGYVVHYVNQGDATKQVCQRFEAVVRAFRHRGPKSPQPKLFAGGFTAYLDDGDLEAFLAAD